MLIECESGILAGWPFPETKAQKDFLAGTAEKRRVREKIEIFKERILRQEFGLPEPIGDSFSAAVDRMRTRILQNGRTGQIGSATVFDRSCGGFRKFATMID